MDSIDIEHRVARGAAFLDQRIPGWERHIDLAVLNIASGRDCTLAQLSKAEGMLSNPCCSALCNGYENGIYALCLDSASVVAFGFQATHVEGVARYEEYSVLTQAWRLEVVRRRMSKVDAAVIKRQHEVLAV